MRPTYLSLILLLLTLLACWPRGAQAIPAFARATGMDCAVCHSQFPRLNDVGQQFRLNGYQVPGSEKDEKTVIDGPTPISMRVNVNYTRDQFHNIAGSANVNQIQIGEVDVISGGVLRQNIGFFALYLPALSPANGVAGQGGELEAANVAFSNLHGALANVRVGRFEPTDVGFSGARSLTISPYEIYAFSFPGGPAMSDTQTGVEFYGYKPADCRYYAGLLQGSNTNSGNNGPADLYLRAEKILGKGEGQTAGHRVGAFVYAGKAQSAAAPGPRSAFNRVGVDAALNFAKVNVALQYLSARDNAALWPGAASRVKYSGGFAEADWSPMGEFVGFARFDWVQAPAAAPGNIKRYTLGGRYYFVDHLAWHTEISRRSVGAPAPGAGGGHETFIATALDVAY